MVRVNRNFWLGLGLGLALSVTCLSSACASSPETKTDKKAMAGSTGLSKAQANELGEMVKDMFAHISEANTAIEKKNNETAYDDIDEAKATFTKLKQKAQDYGLASSGSAASSNSWLSSIGQSSTMQQDASQQGASQKIRIPVYEGNQLISLIRLISNARNQDTHMASLSGTDATAYGHGVLSEESDLTAASGHGVTNGAMTYGHGAMSDQSVVVVDLGNLDQNMGKATRAAESNQFDQAKQALSNIQTQAIDIEYSPSQRPLGRIGASFAKVKTAVDAQQFDAARLALQDVDHDLTQLSQQASADLRPKISSVQTEIRTWRGQIDQHADQVDDKIDGWWTQMSDWFDTKPDVDPRF